MDWNWFFSSFSQSAAALLGILGAFIISKLLGIEGMVNSLKSDLENQIISYNRIKNSLSVRRYSWVNDMCISYDDELIDKIKDGEFDSFTKQERLDYLYKYKNLYKDDDSVISSFEELYEKHKPKPLPAQEQKIDMNGNHIPTVTVSPSKFFDISNIAPEGMWNKVNEERGLINNKVIEAVESSEKFSKLYADTGNFDKSINAINKIIWVLIIAFPLLVIYPLHFMPVEITELPSITFNFSEIWHSIFSLKNILLLLFFFAIEGIFVYFQILTHKIKQELQSIIDNNKKEYREPKSYCDYYQ